MTISAHQAILQRLEAIYENSIDLLFSLDAHGSLIDLNKAADRLFNVPSDILLGMHFSEVIGAANWERFDTKLPNLGRGKRISETEIQCDFKEGVRSLAISIHAVDGTNGDTMYQCIGRDLTEQLATDNQLYQAQKMECLGRLTAGVAHDYNNMLMVIQGHLGMLTHKQQFPPSVEESLNEIARAAQHGHELNKQLLLFGSQHTLILSTLSVNELIENLIKMLRRLIYENIQIRFDRGERIPHVVADRGMLEQVLVNLCTNARDALPKGGNLNIRTRVASSEEWDQAEGLSGSMNGQAVCIEVSDDGTGMDEQTRKRIFEPFFSTKPQGKGTGLGLATAYGIIKQHRGRICVKSAVGAGTTFQIYLPIAKDLPPNTNSEEETEFQKLNGSGTILLVEDDLPVLHTLHQALANHGYKVFPCESSEEALERWELHKGEIDMLFADIVIPGGLLGDELASQFMVEKPKLKVLYMTGYYNRITGKESKLKTNERLLMKPYNYVDMLTKVQELMESTADIQ